MDNIVDHFNGKLYTSEMIKKWNLPIKLEEELGVNQFEYFFLTSFREDPHGELHIHLSLFPTKYKIIYLLEVRTPIIIPELLHSSLNIIKEKKNDIITSTGFCTHKNTCYFGIFFSSPARISPGSLIEDIRKLENVENANLYKYTSEGANQINENDI